MYNTIYTSSAKIIIVMMNSCKIIFLMYVQIQYHMQGFVDMALHGFLYSYHIALQLYSISSLQT